jgi:hypothetical protein
MWNVRPKWKVGIFRVRKAHPKVDNETEAETTNQTIGEILNKIIAHTGAHGTGKTVALHQEVREMKIRWPELKVGFITDTVRGCPFPINRNTSSKSQAWVFCEIVKREMEACAKYDIVISDRAVWDMIAYTVVGAKDYKLADWMTEYCLRVMPVKYKQLIFHPASTCDFCKEDGVRDTDPEFRKAIDLWLAKFYWEYGVKYTVYRND